MVAGHLQEKNGLYYVVLGYKDEKGKRRQPWIPTGLPVKGNKRKAELFLAETRKNFVIPEPINKDGTQELSPNMLFSDFMLVWLEVVKNTIDITTYASYSMMVKRKICPYFEKLGITLGKLEARHIQAFYLSEQKTVSANTVIHEHANIHKALKYAVKMDLIPSNPAAKVERPRVQKFIPDYYNATELEQLFETTDYHRLSLLIRITAFYGLRRSEALGLKWDAFDFEKETFTIKHILNCVRLDGKTMLVGEDRAKTFCSLRTLPLVSNFKECLLALKQQQEFNKKICGNSYNNNYLGYVFVDEMGSIIKPDYVSRTFRSLLEKHGLRRIRFHDLRHSCASLLLGQGVQMKQIQDWLGHGDIATTSNIYAHLDFTSKVSSAEVLSGGLSFPEFKGNNNPWERQGDKR